MPRRRFNHVALASCLASMALLAIPAQGAESTFVALAPLAVTVSTITAPTAAHLYARPSWWNGPCDAAHWNASAVAQGFRRPDHPSLPIESAHALSATYLGVPVCAPMPGGRVLYSWYSGSTRHSKWFAVPAVMWRMANSWGYPEFYCTELAFRFMHQVYGVAPYAAAGGTVVQNYRAADGGGLLRFANRSITPNGRPHAIPRPGDIISFKAGASAASYIQIYLGHVAVVARSTVNPYTGNGYLILLTQNDTWNGWRLVTVHNYLVAGMGSGYAWLPAWGWLHDPHNRGA